MIQSPPRGRRTVSSRIWVTLLCVALLPGLFAATGWAEGGRQVGIDILEFDSGDVYFRSHTYISFASKSARQVVLVPDEGFSGRVFLRRPGGGEGWGPLLVSRGLNAYSLDLVSCGKSIPPPDDDFLKLTEKSLFTVFQHGLASHATLMIAAGQGASFAVKARSIDPIVSQAVALIDPIGPQYSQPMTQLTAADLFEREKHRRAWLWKKWGLGPRPGELRRGLDLSLANVDSLFDLYEPKQPPYWLASMTAMQSGMNVQSGKYLDGWPVLIVRTPAADAEQIAREDAVVQWLIEKGCVVTRMDLAREGLAGVSGLPWAGSKAPEVLDRILEWHSALDLPDPSQLKSLGVYPNIISTQSH